MTDIAAALKEAHRLVLAAFAAQEAKVEEREKIAHKILEDCENQRRAIHQNRAVILQANKLQAKALGLPEESLEPPVTSSAPTESDANESGTDSIETSRGRRARIGPQRYFILREMRSYGAKSPESIAHNTKLPVKRVREQLKADMADGYVEQYPGPSGPHGAEPLVYALTDQGMGLLRRFEHYRKAHGKPLPTLEEAAADQGHNEGNGHSYGVTPASLA